MKQPDIRLLQLIVMAGLLLTGAISRDFSLSPAQVLLTFLSGLLSQWLFIRLLKIPKAGYLSALITCFGISLLLRSDSLWAQPLACFVAIASKFIITINHRHIFNPANLGVILGLTLFPGTWVTSGQWGADLSTALWLISIGFLIAGNAKRLDISLYFLGFYASLFLLIRILWYGYPIAVFFHQFQNGALLLFTFFMITDPMTIPRHKTGRLLHAAIVAVLAYLWQYYLYWNQGILWALFIATPLVPLWNRLFPARPFQWQHLSGDHHA